jgi:hypothetical protein
LEKTTVQKKTKSLQRRMSSLTLFGKMFFFPCVCVSLKSNWGKRYKWKIGVPHSLLLLLLLLFSSRAFFPSETFWILLCWHKFLQVFWSVVVDLSFFLPSFLSFLKFCYVVNVSFCKLDVIKPEVLLRHP